MTQTIKQKYLTVFHILSLIDLETTLIALFLGGQEMNPLFFWINNHIEFFWILIVIKLAGVKAVSWCINRLEKISNRQNIKEKEKRYARAIFHLTGFAAGAITGVTVINNLIQFLLLVISL